MGKPTRNGNPNLSVVRRTVNELGGTIVKQTAGKRRLYVVIRTDRGVEFNFGINLTRVDPHKQRGWVRQRFNKANATRRRK